MLDGRISNFGSVDVLVRVADFEGWTPAAFREDPNFDVRHFNDVRWLALVSEQSKSMALISRPFTAVDVRHFPEAELGAARAWVAGPDAGAAARAS
jgi:hypothetical protein